MHQPDCIFCKIVRGEIPCQEILRTDEALAFLDIQPVHPGHVLVIPLAHHATLLDLPDDESVPVGASLMRALRDVARAVMAHTGAAGVNIMQNNHAAAGQVVFHMHFHVIPRFPDDGLRLWPQSSYASSEAMAAMAAGLRACLQPATPAKDVS